MRSPPGWSPNWLLHSDIPSASCSRRGRSAPAELVTLLQLLTITAAAWMLAWLAARRWINVWRETERGDSPHFRREMGLRASTLMHMQLAMSIAGNALLIGVALVVLAVLPPREQDWTVAAGMPLGWIALVGSVAAAAYRRVQRGRRLSANAIGLIGMTALGLLACTVRLAPAGAAAGRRGRMGLSHA